MTQGTTTAATAIPVSFHGSAAVKEKFLKRISDHAAAGELRRDKTWNGRYGNLVGGLVHRSDYEYASQELGVPVVLLRLAEHFFENLATDWEQWAISFVHAIPLGA